MDGTAGESYNVCSGKSVRISRIVDRLIESSGKSIAVQTDQARFKRADVDDIYGDCQKLAEQLNWEPSDDLDETLAEMVSSTSGAPKPA